MIINSSFHCCLAVDCSSLSLNMQFSWVVVRYRTVPVLTNGPWWRCWWCLLVTPLKKMGLMHWQRQSEHHVHWIDDSPLVVLVRHSDKMQAVIHKVLIIFVVWLPQKPLSKGLMHWQHQTIKLETRNSEWVVWSSKNVHWFIRSLVSLFDRCQRNTNEGIQYRYTDSDWRVVLVPFTKLEV